MEHQKYEWEDVYMWFYKEPLMPTEKFGYLGVRIQNPDRTMIMCNECWKFFKRIHTKHLVKHGLSMEEYRKKYWYAKNTAMIADMESLNLSHKILGKPHSINNNPEALEKSKESRENWIELWKWENSNERQNKLGTCYEQIKDRLKTYIERFWQLPSYNAMWEDWKALFSLLKHRYWDVNRWFQEYWLPTKKLKPWDCVEYRFSDWEVIRVGYKYNENWKLLIDKVMQTSNLFKPIKIELKTKKY